MPCLPCRARGLSRFRIAKQVKDLSASPTKQQRSITIPAKHLHFGTTAREDIQRGIDTLANTVKIPLGPRGRNVVLDKSFGSPLSTKDGVTVARDIELANRFENIGVQMVREVASTTSAVAGDG